MRVHLGSDHADFELKAHVAAHLAGLGHEVVDVGPAEYDPQDDYPPFCIATGPAVLADPVLARSTETARPARGHNDAQVVAIRARMHGLREAEEIAETFLSTPFSGDERHVRRTATIVR